MKKLVTFYLNHAVLFAQLEASQVPEVLVADIPVAYQDRDLCYEEMSELHDQFGTRHHREITFLLGEAATTFNVLSKSVENGTEDSFGNEIKEKVIKLLVMIGFDHVEREKEEITGDFIRTNLSQIGAFFYTCCTSLQEKSQNALDQQDPSLDLVTALYKRESIRNQLNPNAYHLRRDITLQRAFLDRILMVFPQAIRKAMAENTPIPVAVQWQTLPTFNPVPRIFSNITNDHQDLGQEPDRNLARLHQEREQVAALREDIWGNRHPRRRK